MKQVDKSNIVDGVSVCGKWHSDECDIPSEQQERALILPGEKCPLEFQQPGSKQTLGHPVMIEQENVPHTTDGVRHSHEAGPSDKWDILSEQQGRVLCEADEEHPLELQELCSQEELRKPVTMEQGVMSFTTDDITEPDDKHVNNECDTLSEQLECALPEADEKDLELDAESSQHKNKDVLDATEVQGIDELNGVFDDFPPVLYYCRFCSLCTTNKGALMTHEKKKHKKRFSCTQCPAKFCFKTALERHMTRHAEGSPYKCIFCPLEFERKGQLEYHVLRHTGEKPFACSMCPARYTRKRGLEDHELTHSGKKPFGCPTCPAAFANKTYLNSHMRIHTGEKPFACQHCPARFARRNTMVNHLRTHTGERPYICEHCAASFTQKNNLQAHVRLHTGEKPFVCEHCSKAFTHKVSLVTHLRKHAKEEDSD